MRHFAEDGVRLTDCCGAYSTYVDFALCCKACYNEVPVGQGDGAETQDGPAIRQAYLVQLHGV
jgi:hypothetical protein